MSLTAVGGTDYPRTERARVSIRAAYSHLQLHPMA